MNKTIKVEINCYCKDCHYSNYDIEFGYRWCNRNTGIFRVKDNDFCSLGYRKESINDN